jgi:hypothetical protein
VAAALERAAPVYRKHWHSRHSHNARAIAALTAELKRAGAGVAERLTAAFGQAWPTGGLPVEIVAYANWAERLLHRRSPARRLQHRPRERRRQGLETLFHEAMHQRDEAIGGRLRAAAARTGREVPQQLSHTLIFYTAGDAVQRVLGASYVPYAEANGLGERGWGRFRGVLDAHWRPYLRGAGTLEEALEGALKAVSAPATPERSLLQGCLS